MDALIDIIKKTGTRPYSFYSDMIDSECSRLLNPKLFVWLNWHHNTPHAFFLSRQWKKRNPISICAKYLGDVRALMSKGIFPSPPSLHVLLHNTNTFVRPLRAKNSRKSQTSGGGNLGNCTRHSSLSFLFSVVSSDRKNNSVLMPLDQSPYTQRWFSTNFYLLTEKTKKIKMTSPLLFASRESGGKFKEMKRKFSFLVKLFNSIFPNCKSTQKLHNHQEYHLLLSSVRKQGSPPIYMHY